MVGAFLLHDRLRLHRRRFALRQVALNDGVQIVHAVEIGVGQFADFRFDVARYGDIHQQHRLVAARLQRALHHPLTDDRQRAGGGTDDDVGVRQAFVDLRQGDHLRADLVCQQLGALAGAVGDDHVPHFVFAQVARHQFDGFTGTHQQDVEIGQRFEDLARQGTGGKSHGDRAGADVGSGTHALGNGEGFLEQTLQLAGQRLAALRLGESFFTCPRICGSPSTNESNPLATRIKWLTASLP